MLISICYITLPVIILIQSVNSVDLYKSKRVIRDLEEIKTPYNSNHPPLHELQIPVSVIYDDEEDIRIITKSAKESTQSTAASKITLPSSIRNSENPIVLTLKSQFGNGPPAAEAYNIIPVAIVTDNVEEKKSNSKHDEKSVSKDSDQSQFSNGPPTVETYGAIPVAIVTDNEEEKKSKSKNDEKSVSKVLDQKHFANVPPAAEAYDAAAIVTDNVKENKSTSKNVNKSVSDVLDQSKFAHSPSAAEIYKTIPVSVDTDNVEGKKSNSKNEEKSVSKVSDQLQFANVPPATEAYDAIPVAIVTDNVEEKKNNSKADKKSIGRVSDQSQFANGPPAVEVYDTIPVVIVTDNVGEKSSNGKNDKTSVSKLSEQEKVIKTHKSTDVEEKDNKPQGRSTGIEATSGSDTNLNATASNARKSSHRRRLQRVIKPKGHPAVEAYKTIPVVIVSDNVGEKSSNGKNDKTSVSKLLEQEKVSKTHKSTDVEEKDNKPQGRSTEIEATSGSDTNLNATASNTRKSSNRRRLHRVIKPKGPPAVEAYKTIPVVIVSDNVEEKSSLGKNEKPPVSKLLDQKEPIKAYNSTDVAEKVKKPQGRSTITEATAGSDTNLNATANNARKSSHRRRLHRVIKSKVEKDQTSRNEKTNKTPVVRARVQTNENLKNESQPTISSQFQKRTQQRDPIVKIVDSENFLYAYNGDYHYSYEGGDGTKAYERGELKTAKGGSSGTEVVGGFSYTDNDGNDFSLSYTADENGYRPIGAHLPTPPPIPPAIQRALDILATKTTPEPITERVNKLN